MLDKDQWQEVRRLFHSALALPPAQRSSFLAAERGIATAVLEEARDLLAHHTESQAFLAAPEPIVPEMEPASRIGPYEVRGVLGRGGMGTVYRAVRVDGAYRTQVAIKVLHTEWVDPQLEQRFLRERQILADLEHDSIARLLDGGTTEDGRPYLVLEYVDGEPIDRYCDRHCLSIRKRLELFCRVCGAVHFAHQNLVVHRDLKPGNILVSAEGRLKLLDFGIAKLLGSYETGLKELVTGPALSPMTPEFASPEQMQGKTITTGCDIYALGTLLYSLLAGKRPFQALEAAPQAFVQALCFEDPEFASVALRRALSSPREQEPRAIADARGLEPMRLVRALAGDLDRIVAKALRKDPRQRYLSAEELSRDVRRHLDGQPVAARDQTWRYRAGKFVRRHRLPVALATAALLAFAAFTAALLVQQAHVLRERSHGEEVTRLLEGLFETSDPDRVSGERITARELLDRGSIDIRHRLEDQPVLRARLLATMGRIYRKLGLYDEAAPLVREALDLRRQALGGVHREVADSLLDLAEQSLAVGDYDQAKKHFEQGWAMLQDVGTASGEYGARALSGLSRAFQKQGLYDRARSLRQQSLDLAREDLGETHVLVAVNLNELGGLLREQGDYAAAAQAYGSALDLYRKLYGDVHPRVADLHNDLGLLYDEQGRFADAHSSFKKALAIQEKVYEGDHPEIANVRYNLAAGLLAQGHFEKAEKEARLAEESRRDAFGQRHPLLADSLNQLGMIHRRRGDLAEAESLLRQALEMWRQLFGPEFIHIAAARNNLSQVLQERGDPEGAERELTEALRIYRETFGEEHRQVANVLSNRALIYRKRGDLKAARQGYEESLKIFRSLHGPENPAVATVTHNLALVLKGLGEPEAAERSFRQALAALEASLPPHHMDLGFVRKNLASTLLSQDKALQAEEELEKALLIFEARPLAPDDGIMLATRGMLGEAYALQGRFEAAEEILVDCLEKAQGRYEKGNPYLEKTRQRLEELKVRVRGNHRGGT